MIIVVSQSLTTDKVGKRMTTSLDFPFIQMVQKKKLKEDTCLDVTLIIGYIIFNYTNFNY